MPDSKLDLLLKEKRLAKELPKFLYHYTNADALINIIQSNEFWFTHVKYFSDRSEYFEGLKLALEIVESRSQSISNELQGIIKKVLSDRLYAGLLHETIHVGIMSFSEERDLLSQWRGYTNHGLGASLCFKAQIFKNSDINAFLLPCIYETEEKTLVINAIIDECVDLLSRGKFEIEQLSAQIFWLFHHAILSFKNFTFREEKEWRLITFPFTNRSERLCFRPATSTIVPFLKDAFPLDRCLDEVIVGPSEHQSLTVESIEMLLKKQGYWTIDVSPSRIPYRKV